jgi:hypothetical protein
MPISSHTLFHFTPKIEYLQDIIANGFWPRYCQENGWGNRYYDFAVPMVCFCDIPLSHIKEHANFYGKFGIGVSPKWIQSHKSITPVQYVALKSHEYNHINRLLTKLKNEDLLDIELKKLTLAKKVSGKTLGKDNALRNKKFYDEREWRYVPDNIDVADLVIPIPKKELWDPQESSQKTKGRKLKVDIDSIVYLIIPSDKEKPDIIKVLQKVYQGISNDQLLSLISKIITLKQIEDDF